jgi:hypothetical protein
VTHARLWMTLRSEVVWYLDVSRNVQNAERGRCVGIMILAGYYLDRRGEMVYNHSPSM